MKRHDVARLILVAAPLLLFALLLLLDGWLRR